MKKRDPRFMYFFLYISRKKTWTLFNVLFIWFILDQSHQINYLPEVKYSSPPKVLKCIFANKSKQTLEMFPYLFRKHHFNLLKWVYLLFKDPKDVTKAFGSSAFASCWKWVVPAFQLPFKSWPGQYVVIFFLILKLAWIIVRTYFLKSALVMKAFSF